MLDPRTHLVATALFGKSLEEAAKDFLREQCAEEVTHGEMRLHYSDTSGACDRFVVDHGAIRISCSH